MLTNIHGEVDNNTIIQGDFDTPLTSMDRLSIQEVNKSAEVLNDTVYLLNLIEIYQTLHPQKAEYTFFSSAHGMTCRIDYLLDHKTSLSKFNTKESILRNVF